MGGGLELMGYFDELLNLIDKYKRLGIHELSNGTKLIGHVPHIGPDAYLHIIFPGLSGDEITKIEEEIQRPLPTPLKEFLVYSNGIDLFSGAFSISGYRNNYVRTGDESIQPFSITTPNVEERLNDAPHEAVFFGFYDWDGSSTWMVPSDQKVYRCSIESAEPISDWKDLGSMLISETKRLSTLFDEKGRLLNENISTAP